MFGLCWVVFVSLRLGCTVLGCCLVYVVLFLVFWQFWFFVCFEMVGLGLTLREFLVFG